MKLAAILVSVLILSTFSAAFAAELSLKTDSSKYLPGDQLIVSGNTEANASVSIQVKNPGGQTILLRIIQADSSGNYEMKFKIPGSGVSGNYEIISSVVSEGIPIIESKTVLVEEKKEQQVTQTTKAEETSDGGGCLIATAAFGSEMAPQVQFLRELRDNTVLQTQSGTSFMTGFNQFYYSFSPAVADLERENPIFKEAVKLTLTPLLTSLTLLNYVDIDSESEMLGYGIGIIMLNIGMYFVAPAALLITMVKRSNFCK